MIAAPHNLQLELPLEQIADFCHRWGIARLEIFGSALRDDFRPEHPSVPWDEIAGMPDRCVQG